MTTLAKYTYLGVGNVVQVDYPEAGVRYDLVTGGSSTNPYGGLDRFGRVVDLQWQKYTGTPTDLVRLGYGYDRVSNRTYREDQVAPGGFDELYGYDGLHRLKDFDRGDLNAGKTAITSPTLEQAWGLDATGNWSTFTQNLPGSFSEDLTQSRTHNTVNEITAISETVGAGWVTPQHDRNGNMTLMPQPEEPTEGFRAVYDAWNRLVRLEADAEPGSSSSSSQSSASSESSSSSSSSAGPGEVVIEDDFTGMTAGENLSAHTPTPIDNGNAWTQSAPGDVISDGSGAIKFITNGIWGLIDSEASEIETTIVWNSGGADNRFSVIARSDGTLNNRIAMNVRPGASLVVLQKVVSGTLTELASVTHAISDDANHTVRLVCRGTSIQGYIDGILVISAISSANQTRTFAGVMHNKFVNDAARWHSFEAADYALESSSSSSSSASQSSSSTSSSSSESSPSSSSSSSSSSNEPLIIDYAYNGLNWRTQKTIGNETRHFYYSSAWRVVEERSDNSTDPDRQYVWGQRYIDDLVVRERDTTGNGTFDERLYAMQDDSWNTMAIAGTAGVVQERYNYTPYGVSIVLDSNFNIRAFSNFEWTYRYTGRELDLETLICQYRNRYYHAGLGRFLTRDIVGYFGGLNLYQYVLGRPLRFVDALGLLDEKTAKSILSEILFANIKKFAHDFALDPLRKKDVCPNWMLEGLSNSQFLSGLGVAAKDFTAEWLQTVLGVSKLKAGAKIGIEALLEIAKNIEDPTSQEQWEKAIKEALEGVAVEIAPDKWKPLIEPLLEIINSFDVTDCATVTANHTTPKDSPHQRGQETVKCAFIVCQSPDPTGFFGPWKATGDWSLSGVCNYSCKSAGSPIECCCGTSAQLTMSGSGTVNFSYWGGVTYKTKDWNLQKQ